jgi:hypothetical protein
VGEASSEGGVLGATVVFGPAAFVIGLPDTCPQPIAISAISTTPTETRCMAFIAIVLELRS